MLKGFKKLVSAFCATAMVLSLAVVPAMATDDFSLGVSSNSGWTGRAGTGAANSQITAAANADGYLQIKSTGSAQRYITYDLANSFDSGTVNVTYTVNIYARGDTDNRFFSIGSMANGTGTYSNGILVLNVPKSAETASINGNSFTVNGTDYWTGKLTVSANLDLDNKKLTSCEVTKEGVADPLYSLAAPQDISGSEISRLRFDIFKNTDEFDLYSLSISEKELPVITQSASSVVAGNTVEVAKVTNANTTPTVEITGANAAKFSYSVEASGDDYLVKVSANDTASTSSYSANVKITASSGDGSVNKTITLTASPVSEYLGTLLAGLKLTGVATSNVTAVSGKTDEFDITGDFTVTHKDGDAAITWTPSTSALIPTSDPGDANNILYEVDKSKKVTGATLKAKVTYNGQESEERVFTLNIKPENPDVPTITVEDTKGMEARVGSSVKLATVTNYKDISVDVSDSNFTVTKVNGEIKLVTVTEPENQVTVTVTVNVTGNDADASKTISIKAIPTSKYPMLMAEGIDIENGSSVVKNGSVYDVTSDFTVPLTAQYDYAADTASVVWSSDTDAVVFDNDGVANVSADSSTGTLTATVTYAGKTYSKTFDIKLADHKYVKYYDESFDGTGFSNSGNIIYAHSGNNEATINNILFHCGTRDEGDSDKIGVAGISGVTGNGVKLFASKNNNDSRNPYISLPACKGTYVANTIYTSFNFSVADGSELYVSDTANNVLSFKPDSDIKADTWYRAELISDGTSAAMTVFDTSDNIILQKAVNFGLTNKFYGPVTNTIANSIDNLKVMDLKAVRITPDVPEKINATGDGNWVEVAVYDKAMASSVQAVSDNANMEAKAEDGKIYVHALTDDVVTADITVTADADVTTKSKFSVTSASDTNFVDSALLALTVVDGTKVKSGLNDTNLVLGDFTVPTSAEGATVTWSVPSKDSDYVKVSGANVTVYPYSTLDDTVELVATVTYGGESKTKTFKLDLSNLKAKIIEAVDAYAAANGYMTYANDAAGKYFKNTLADGMEIFADVYVPEETVKYNDYPLTVAYKFTGAIGSDGKISVASPSDEKDATITKSISYVKNGAALYTKEIENTAKAGSNAFDAKVKFDPADVQPKVEAAVYTANETTEAMADDAVKAEVNAAIKAFVSEPAVALDAANIKNFYAKVGSSSTEAELPNSISTGFTVKTEGVFGSKIAWISGNSSRVGISAAGEGFVTQGTQDAAAKLTAVVSYGDGDSQAKNTEAYTKTVSVPGKGGSSGGSSGGGSSRSSGGSTGTTAIGTVSAVPASDTSTYEPNPNPSGFTDLDSVDWAKTAINNLYVNNIVSGKAPNLFYPNDKVTRAEFAKILVNSFHLPKVTVEEPTFYDVPLKHWASEFVEAAFAAGVIKGFDDGSFEPNTYVTRQDMAVMVLRAAQAAGRTFTEKREAQVFGDDATVAAYAKPAITTLQKAGIVNGVENGNFAPLSTSTRAQACQIIYNVIK